MTINKNNLFEELKSLTPKELASFDSENKEPCTDEKPITDLSKKALDYAIRILGIRDYSIHKMKEKLQTRKYSAEIIDETINKLLEYNYIREEEYTRSRIKQLLYKNFADNYIIQKVKAENLKITSEMIDEVKSEYRISTTENICYLIEKKLRGKTIPTDYKDKMKLKQKIVSFLVSKGYNFDEINNNLSSYL